MGQSVIAPLGGEQDLSRMEDIPYYKDYLSNAIRGGIVSGCFLSIFIVVGIVNKFRWKDEEENEDSIQEYEVSGKVEMVDHEDIIKVTEKCQDFDSDIKIETEKVCDASDDDSGKSRSSKAEDDANRELTGCENTALELEEK